jgi:hypothetical protein
MQEIFQRWLTRRPRCPGVVGWGVCLPDRSTVSQSFTAGVQEGPLAALWGELAEVLQQMPQHEAETGQMRWVFSLRVLYAAVRPDGACLAVLAERSQDEAGRACIERTLADFRALRVSGMAR